MKTFKNNGRTKIIAILSAIVLWLYVMTVVDPIESRVYKEIPVTITNTNEITDNGLVIYPKETLTTNIYVKGKLSNLKRIDTDNIRVYGRVEQPTEGKNIIVLRSNLSDNVSYEITPNNVTIQLQKNITSSKKIKLNLYGKEKNNIDTIKFDKDSVDVSGPKELVEKVSSAIAELDMTNKEDDFSSTLKLVPKDKNGIEVKGVKLNNYFIKTDIVLLKEKTVPIKAVINNSEKNSKKTYKLSQSEVTIKGNGEAIASIESINTKPIDLSTVNKNTTLNVELDIPKDIKSTLKSIEVEVSLNSQETKTFKIPKSSVKFTNNNTQIDTSKSNLPDYIEVTVSSDDINSIKESDIELYVDLSEKSEDGTYKISYKNVKNVKITNISTNNVKIQ